MIERIPMLAADNRPACFAISHDLFLSVCRNCAWEKKCALRCAAWEGVRSLAEMAHAASQRLTALAAKDQDGDDDLPKLYDLLYEKYLGRKPWKAAAQNAKTVRVLLQVAKFCDERKLDLAMYVAAQMVGLRDWLKTQKFGFGPTMLLGEKALARYNANVRKLDRKFHHAAEDAMSDSAKALREQVFEDELSIGAYICAAALKGTPVPLVDAVAAARLSGGWYTVAMGIHAPEVRQRAAYVVLCDRHREGWVKDLLNSARLNAAVAVADRYKPGLSSLLSFSGDLDWSAFADVIAQVVATPKQSAGMPGIVADNLWQPCSA